MSSRVRWRAGHDESGSAVRTAVGAEAIQSAHGPAVTRRKDSPPIDRGWVDEAIESAAQSYRWAFADFGMHRAAAEGLIRAALPIIEAGLREQIATEVRARLGVTSRALPIIQAVPMATAARARVAATSCEAKR